MSKLLIGCWSREKTTKGLNICSFNDETGEIEVLNNYLKDINIACDPVIKDNDIYLCEDMSITRTGNIIENDYIYHGKLFNNEITDIFQNSSLGVNITYCALDCANKYLLASHHTSSKHKVSKLYRENGKVISKVIGDDAALVLFKINNGKLTPIDYYISECSDDSSSILHSLYRIKDLNLYFACDKGLDRVFTFKIDQENEKIVILDQLQFPKGYDCRYGCVHSYLNLIYINNEQKSVIDVISYNNEGKLNLLQEIDSLPIDDKPLSKMLPSDIKITSNGKYLYSAIRGKDKIACFNVNADGMLNLIENIDCLGQFPRGLAISNNDKYLLCANNVSGNVVVFEINEGKLNKRNELALSKASCFKFF